VLRPVEQLTPNAEDCRCMAFVWIAVLTINTFPLELERALCCQRVPASFRNTFRRLAGKQRLAASGHTSPAQRTRSQRSTWQAFTAACAGPAMTIHVASLLHLVLRPVCSYTSSALLHGLWDEEMHAAPAVAQVGGLKLDNYRTTLPLKKGLSSSAAICVLVRNRIAGSIRLDLPYAMLSLGRQWPSMHPVRHHWLHTNRMLHSPQTLRKVGLSGALISAGSKGV